MKTLFHITIVLLTALLSGCFAPVTQTYDSARMVKKDKLEVKANYSFYENVSYETYNDDEDFIKNTNFGVALVYGLEDKTNLGLRYEYINNQITVIDSFSNSGWLDNVVNSIYLDAYSDIHFFKFNPKFSLKQDRIAFSAPVGFYSPVNSRGGALLEFKPRFHFTFPNKQNTFEFSVIPQGRFFISGGGIAALIPSLGLGMGVSTDLDKWAIRPEISYDYWTIAVGLSGSYRFNLNKNK